MSHVSSRGASARTWAGARRLFWTLLLLAPLFLATADRASAAIFLNAAMSDLKPEQRVAVSHPQPVQLLFQFQTKGAPNRAATKFVHQQVIDTVKGSGLFSDVSEAPVPSGAVINIVIDNIPMKDAASKGFVTGLTFGLKGTLAEDDYVCTVDYVASPTASKITKTANHALYTQVGNVAAPPNGVKAANMNEAALTMVRQIISHPLNDLAGDRAFNPDAAAAPEPPPTSTPETPAPAATPDTPSPEAASSPNPS